MLGRVGSDDFGRRMRDNLEGVGCDVSALAMIPDCVSGIALIFVADDGHNSIIIVQGLTTCLPLKMWRRRKTKSTAPLSCCFNSKTRCPR